MIQKFVDKFMEQKETADEVWSEFWAPICTKADGSLNLEQVKKELSDFHYVMQQVPKVYSHITGNLLSKIMYEARIVIDAADKHYEDFYRTEDEEPKP